MIPPRFESGTAYFQVSQSDFDEVQSQIRDAVAYLRANQAQLKRAMGGDGSGELDFAVEWRDVAIQCDVFPAELVRETGKPGLALCFSHYPPDEAISQRTDPAL